MRVVFSTFRLRRFITNLLLLSFLVSAISGVVLFFRPEGSLARWVGWSVFGLDKKQWEAVHLVFVGAFLLVSLTHIWYNWKPLVAYLRQRTAVFRSSTGRRRPSPDLLAAVAVTVLVFCGTLVEWQPFSGMFAIRTAMKDGAFAAVTPPPIPDADRLTFSEMCRRAAIPEQEALRNAQEHGLVISATSMTIATIARAHNVSPEAVYRALRERGPRRVQP